MKYQELYKYGVEQLETAGIAEAALDARLLLEHVCHTDRNTLLAYGDRVVAAEWERCYVNLIEERKAHIPLQHLTGEQEFMGLSFRVNEHVLIPRQDTEILVEEAMRELHDGMELLDMCTGSGCILLSLLHYSNDCRGTGVDISPQALLTARENAEALGIAADFVQSDLFAQLDTDRKFDMLVSNPPYIPSDVIETLMPEVREHEPLTALNGGRDGLHFYRQISKGAKQYLNGGAWLFFEIGCDQAADVCGILAADGYLEIEVVKDFAGLDRVVKCMFQNGGRNV
ncbi:MAG: peptide chain release factor N(5)-glutamine methyltransferase [Lachnospiraceae bacterium]|nr:peptide chain release factor N(5)-glutamine methyltransferase [Lachnospiraceae bacterium]